MLKKMLTTLALTLSYSIGSNAAVIVDTGPGPSSQGGWSLYSGQWLAAEFTLDQQFTLTDVKGWIGGDVGTATVAIYTDGGSIPGSELFSSGFSAVSAGGDWSGASGQTWLLGPGIYWVAFEVRDGDNFDGWMSQPVSSPLSDYAFTSVDNWINNDGMDFGVQISGVASVPVPAAAWLSGSALLGLVGVRRKS